MPCHLFLLSALFLLGFLCHFYGVLFHLMNRYDLFNIEKYLFSKRKWGCFKTLNFKIISATATESR